MKSKIKNKTFLITGGAGFIGSHACDFIIKNGGKAFCLDNFLTGKMRNISHLLKNRNFRFYRCDVNSQPSLKQVFEKVRPDYIMHYAAVVGVKRTIKNPLMIFEDFKGTQNIAALAGRYKSKRIFFSSSSEVYGEPIKLPINENDVFNARLPYGLVKILSEKYFQEFSKKSGIPVTIARFFNVYGPRQDFGESGFVAPIFIKNALLKEPLLIFGRGSQTRDFVFIDDNIRLSFKAFFNDNLNSKPLNIGSGQSVKILTLARLIKKITGSGSKIQKAPQRSKGEIIYRQPDVRLMKKTLKDWPNVSLERGLGLSVDYYRKIL